MPTPKLTPKPVEDSNAEKEESKAAGETSADYSDYTYTSASGSAEEELLEANDPLHCHCLSFGDFFILLRVFFGKQKYTKAKETKQPESQERLRGSAV